VETEYPGYSRRCRRDCSKFISDVYFMTRSPYAKIALASFGSKDRPIASVPHSVCVAVPRLFPLSVPLPRFPFVSRISPARSYDLRTSRERARLRGGSIITEIDEEALIPGEREPDPREDIFGDRGGISRKSNRLSCNSGDSAMERFFLARSSNSPKLLDCEMSARDRRRCSV